jgi:hypothetical protein
MPPFAKPRRAAAPFLIALLLCAIAGRIAECQAPRARVGLPSAGGIGVFVGGGRVTHDVPGGEVGIIADLGWLWAPRLRLVSDVSWFIGSLHEYVAQDDEDISGPIFDLGGTVSLQALSGSAASRGTGYASLGVSIHVLSSSFNSLPLDLRYNANRFGLAGTVGGRAWVGSGGTESLFAEVRAQAVTQVSGWRVRAGYIHNFAPMTRPARR